MHDFKIVSNRTFVLSLLALLVIPTHAQKQERVCQGVARINDDIITRQAYLAAARDYSEDLARQMKAQGKDDKAIEEELERRKTSVIDGLVDEFLLAQRASELGLDADVELKRLEESVSDGPRNLPQFLDELRKQGFDLELAAAAFRRQLLGQRAIQIEVLEPIFRSITESERRDFYDNHKEQFMLPATVTVSEVFLPFRDQSDAAVSQRAAKLLTELRAGADFLKAVAENTPASRPSFETRGSLGTIRLAELKENLAAALAKLNRGEFTQPLRLDSGYQIIRLDARMPATPRSYEDPMTQAAASRSMTMERAAGTRKSYIARLREKARIEICPIK